MEWNIPGTLLTIHRQEAQGIEKIFATMFLPGGMTLGQITGITGIEPYTVQNWVKRGFLAPPEKKRYSQNQLCRILTIQSLKSVLSLEQICSLIGYVNGRLDSAEDDIIDDSQLYFLFVKLAGRIQELYDENGQDVVLESMLEDYVEPVPGAKERVTKALRVMLTAFLASRMANAAGKMLENL